MIPVCPLLRFAGSLAAETTPKPECCNATEAVRPRRTRGFFLGRTLAPNPVVRFSQGLPQAPDLPKSPASLKPRNPKSCCLSIWRPYSDHRSILSRQPMYSPARGGPALAPINRIFSAFTAKAETAGQSKRISHRLPFYQRPRNSQRSPRPYAGKRSGIPSFMLIPQSSASYVFNFQHASSARVFPKGIFPFRGLDGRHEGWRSTQFIPASKSNQCQCHKYPG